MQTQVEDSKKNEIEELESRLEALRAQLRDLTMMGTVITSIHEIESVLSVVMDMALQLVHGEVGLLMVADGDQLSTKISWGVKEDFVRSLKYADEVDPAAYCFSHREAVIMTDLDLHSAEGILVTSLVALPIATQDKCLGVLILINKDRGGNYNDHDREVLAMLLNFVAVAIDNSNLMKEELNRQKIEQEMAIAKQVQETILPRQLAKLPGVEIGAAYVPAGAVSGDFYDLFPIDDHRFFMIVGDVSNKGVPAALVMSASSGIIKTILSFDPEISVSGLADRLNTLLSNEIVKDREMFVTLFFSKIDINDGTLTYCNAGHLPGLFWDSAAQKVVELAEGGSIIGQFAGIPFSEGKRNIVSGDRLFLFTDGLTEANDAQCNMFGRTRVMETFKEMSGLPPDQFCQEFKEKIIEFSKGSPEETFDDLTLLQLLVR